MNDITPSLLWGLVDMGSNGIRFSITDISSPSARSLPVVFQERLGISLYDAQWSSGKKGPIPQNVIDDVLVGMQRFQLVCKDFEVPESNIKVLATEATRNAENSEDYRKQIYNITGWQVEMLPKEAEGRIGALGIASSFDIVEGLVMDLGGGSTQLTWMEYNSGEVKTSPKGSVSFPYGAAAMTQLLKNIEEGKHSEKHRAELRSEIKSKYIEALETLALPDTLLQKMKSHGLTLYLSGGGFRGWGYILMSRAKKGPYPIPIINGYHASVKDFSDTDAITSQAESSDNIFRVSKRRASQVPAVAFLVSAIIEAFPFITSVRFCQGGVREGYLFDQLPSSTKAQSPLSSATARFATDFDSAAQFAELLTSALPANGESIDRHLPPSLANKPFLRALADTMYIQRAAPKETASLSALYLPISGVLAAAHGISHTDRALLALALCRRWDGDLPPPHDEFRFRLQQLLSNQEVWWATYLGVIAAFIGAIYPSGRISREGADRLSIRSSWSDGLGKKGNQQGVVLSVKVLKSGILGKDMAGEAIEDIEGLGKKKNRVGGKEYGFGVPVRVDVEWV